jgi:hypothetical protein
VSYSFRATSDIADVIVLDKYQYSDIPLPSRAVEEDPMYHRHLARIRTMSAFCRLLIASHLFGVVCDHRSDLAAQTDENRAIAIAHPALLLR